MVATIETLLRRVTLDGFSGDPNYELTQALPEALTEARTAPGRTAFSLRFVDSEGAACAGSASVQVVNVRGSRVTGAAPETVTTGRLFLMPHSFNMQLGVRVISVASDDGAFLDIFWSDF